MMAKTFAGRPPWKAFEVAWALPKGAIRDALLDFIDHVDDSKVVFT
jgi:hypothetical protein